MKYFLLIFMFCAPMFFVGCVNDNDGDGKTTRACWNTVDEAVIFLPCYHWHPHKRVISNSDINTIQNLLNADPVIVEEDVKPWKYIVHTSRWEVRDALTIEDLNGIVIGNGHWRHGRGHGYGHWHRTQYLLFVGEWIIDLTKPVTLQLVTTHCPKIREFEPLVTLD